MSTLSTQDARGVLRKAIVAAYAERPKVMNFLRSFFKTEEKGTQAVSIEVQRGFEKVAVDVTRGSEGNRNEFSKFTEKVIIPPLFKEYFDATQLDGYNNLFRADGRISEREFADYVVNVTDKTMLCRDKIERAYELQASQVFESGIVQLNAATNINFKRKSASLVDLGSGNYWTTGSNSPYETLKTAATFLRTKGKARGS